MAGVTLAIKKGESLGLVGGSGCGKSSLAKAAMRFIDPASGRILLNGQDLLSIDKSGLRHLRPKFQMIFQDSFTSFNPQRSIGDAVAMPLKLTGIKSRTRRAHRAHRMMERVGLAASLYDRRPHQLSGGQCQRAQIARALITEPELLICDEPLSALDVLIQAQILGLLDKLRKDHRLGMLFISHDLAVVNKICDRVAVMVAGEICEVGNARRLFQSPQHPYTEALLRAIPAIDRGQRMQAVLRPIAHAPAQDRPDAGCSYRWHCQKAEGKCFHEKPALTPKGPDGRVACHFPLNIQNSWKNGR